MDGQAPGGDGPRQHGPERQAQIYQAGLAGQRPALPVSFEALEQRARETLSAEAFAYVAGGAGAEDTMRANLEAFRRWQIVPRMLRDVSARDLRVRLFGRTLPAPVLLAPVGVLGLVHPEGEVAVARAAASIGVPFVLSSVSSRPLEEVAQAAGDGPRWFQLYWGRNRDVAASFVARAERAGFGAVVVTLDTPFLGWRERDLDLAFVPFLRAQGVANYFSDPAFVRALEAPPQADPGAAVRRVAGTMGNPALTWSDLAWLRGQTRLPIALKGILHPDDAARAVDHGADAIVVSNHGGRQVDGAVGALEALPEVAAAARRRIPVLFDSGIRRGADVMKALCLGASAVLLGRPYVWGLAVAGEAGVREVLLNVLADLDLTMALAGFASPQELSVRALVYERGRR